MSKNIEMTMAYLKDAFLKSDYFTKNPTEREYRFRHSIRVANIGAEIAKKENFNVEAMTIACLLHDIGYIHTFNCEEDWRNHGRTSAKIAKEYLETLDLSEEIKQEICYGIAIHVDDKADFEGVKTPFTASVGDADNIDRFDVYRIYENLQISHFSEMKHDEQMAYVDQKIERLNKLVEMAFGSHAATSMWQERVNYQMDFFNKMKRQLESGESLSLVL